MASIEVTGKGLCFAAENEIRSEKDGTNVPKILEDDSSHLGMNHHPQGSGCLFGPRYYQTNIIIPGGGRRWPNIIDAVLLR